MPNSATRHVIAAGQVGELVWDLIFTGPGRGYLDRTHIFLWVDDIQLGVGGGAGAVGFTWVNDTRVSLVGYVPALGEKLEFRRTMPNDNTYRQFTDGAGLTEAQLRDQALANLFAIHEIIDGFGTGIYSSYVLARQYATNPVGVAVQDPDYPGSFSALHWAFQSLTSADDAEVARLAAAASEIQTGLDAAAVAADLVQTDLDTIATAADRVQTGNDLVQTDLDTIATAADRVQTGLDAVATAADRVQTGLDAAATAADLVQTDLDTVATAADRVQTGLDVIDAAASATAAADSALDASLSAASVNVPSIVVGDESRVLRVKSDLTGYALHDAPNNNLLINGGFDIWQRATSQTTNGYGSDDRWSNQHSGSTKTANQQTFTLGQTDVPGNPTYFSRHVVTSIAGANNYVIKTQRMEGVSRLSGKTVTVSFWAKADAARNITTGLLQSFGSGGSANVDGIGVTTHALTTSWQKFTATFTVPSVAGKTVGAGSFTQFEFWFDAGSTYNTRSNSLGQQSGTFDIAQVKIEEGSVATPFEARPQEQELALCQRYYEFIDFYLKTSIAQTTAVLRALYTFKTAKRANPTIVETSGNARYMRASTYYTADALSYLTTVNRTLVTVDGYSFTVSLGYLLLMTFSADAEL